MGKLTRALYLAAALIAPTISGCDARLDNDGGLESKINKSVTIDNKDSKENIPQAVGKNLEARVSEKPSAKPSVEEQKEKITPNYTVHKIEDGWFIPPSAFSPELTHFAYYTLREDGMVVVSVLNLNDFKTYTTRSAYAEGAPKGRIPKVKWRCKSDEKLLNETILGINYCYGSYRCFVFGLDDHSELSISVNMFEKKLIDTQTLTPSNIRRDSTSLSIDGIVICKDLDLSYDDVEVSAPSSREYIAFGGKSSNNRHVVYLFKRNKDAKPTGSSDSNTLETKVSKPKPEPDRLDNPPQTPTQVAESYYKFLIGVKNGGEFDKSICADFFVKIISDSIKSSNLNVKDCNLNVLCENARSLYEFVVFDDYATVTFNSSSLGNISRQLLDESLPKTDNVAGEANKTTGIYLARSKRGTWKICGIDTYKSENPKQGTLAGLKSYIDRNRRLDLSNISESELPESEQNNTAKTEDPKRLIASIRDKYFIDGNTLRLRDLREHADEDMTHLYDILKQNPNHPRDVLVFDGRKTSSLWKDDPTNVLLAVYLIDRTANVGDSYATRQEKVPQILVLYRKNDELRVRLNDATLPADDKVDINWQPRQETQSSSDGGLDNKFKSLVEIEKLSSEERAKMLTMGPAGESAVIIDGICNRYFNDTFNREELINNEGRDIMRLYNALERCKSGENNLPPVKMLQQVLVLDGHRRNTGCNPWESNRDSTDVLLALDVNYDGCILVLYKKNNELRFRLDNAMEFVKSPFDKKVEYTGQNDK